MTPGTMLVAIVLFATAAVATSIVQDAVRRRRRIRDYWERREAWRREWEG